MLNMPTPLQNKFFLELAAGRAFKSYIVPGRKDNVITTALDDMTELASTPILPRPGGIRLEVVSTSADDTLLGTGAQTAEIYFLDSNGAEQHESIELDGLTPALTASDDIADVQWMHVGVSGSGKVAAGNLILRTVGGAGTDYEFVLAGGNQSLTSRIVVPAGMTGYILNWHCSAVTQKMEFKLRATVSRFDRSTNNGAFLFQDNMVLKDAPSPPVEFDVPLECPAGSTIKVSAQSFVAAGDASCSFEVMFVVN